LLSLFPDFDDEATRLAKRGEDWHLRVLRRCIRKMGIVQKIRTRCRFHLGGCAQSGGSGSVIGREPTCAGCLEGRRLRRSDHSTHVKTPIEAP
jgi:hypothetical protein